MIVFMRLPRDAGHVPQHGTSLTHPGGAGSKQLINHSVEEAVDRSRSKIRPVGSSHRIDAIRSRRINSKTREKALKQVVFVFAAPIPNSSSLLTGK